MNSSILREKSESDQNESLRTGLLVQLSRRFGLWPRMAIASSLGFIVLLVLLMFSIERMIEDSTSRQNQERLAVAHMAAGSVENYFQTVASELEYALQFGDSGALERSATNKLLDVLEQGGNYPFGIFVQDASGLVLEARPAQLFESGTDVTEYLTYYRPPSGNQFRLSEPFLDPLHRHPVTALAVPISGESGIRGYLGVLIDLDNAGLVNPLRTAVGVEETEHAVLTDRQGRVLVSTLGVKFLDPGEHFSFYQRVHSAGKPVVEIVPFELDLEGEPLGHKHVMAYVPLKLAPWGIALGGDTTAAPYAAIESLRSSLLASSVGILAAIWILTLLGAITITRPVRQLTEAARKIAAGDGSVVLETQGGGEIREMSTALETMHLRLAENIDELASWNTRLERVVDDRTAELKQKREQVRRLHGALLDAQERERARVALELHDELGQTLTAIEMSLALVAQSLPNEFEDERERLHRSRDLTEHAIGELRRIISALRPGVLDQLGLVPALEWNSSQLLLPNGIEMKIVVDEPGARYPPEVETVLFRIAQEAMANVVKHSGATVMELQIRHNEGYITMILSDNGSGRINGGGESRERLGLAGMRERALLVNGTVEVHQEAGVGTTVEVTVPFDMQEESEQPVKNG